MYGTHNFEIRDGMYYFDVLTFDRWVDPFENRPKGTNKNNRLEI